MHLALISHPDCLLHETGFGHPEQPDRLRAIENSLMHSNIANHIHRYQAPLATKEQLLRVHDEPYIEDLFRLSPSAGIVSLDPDTVMNPYTLNAALRAAGSVVYAVDLVLGAQETKLAFCNVRPPGHHAERARAMGFCFFNNVAVGVAHALAQYQLKRVAIIDFDVHHGNGTEDIFQNEKKVLLCSSFQYPLYPDGDIESTDHILKIPLPSGTTGQLFRGEIERHWLGQIKKFEPELIFFSAGFDGHFKEMIANLKLTEADYAWVTEKMRQIADIYCQGRMISVLEGGYVLAALGSSALAHVSAMLGQSSPL